MATPPAIVPLILFFVALTLCFWRTPQADRLHVKLCLLAGGIWASLPMFEPSMRRSGYLLVVATFLVTALLQPLRRSTTPD